MILFIAYASVTLFNLMVCGVTLLAMFEYHAMSLPAGRAPERRLAAGAGAALVAVLAWYPGLFQPALVLCVIVFGILLLLRFHDLASVVQHLSLLLFGLLYLPLLLGHLSLLHGLESGKAWVFLVLLIAMAGDTAAYFVGVSVGRRKLYPAISPNKSVEGALGGLAGSFAGALLARAWFFPELALYDCALLGVGLGVLGQLGDLFESMLKRSFGVKDSGTLIPGHGGILDRLDSLLFVFPPAYYYALLRFGGQ